MVMKKAPHLSGVPLATSDACPDSRSSLARVRVYSREARPSLLDLKEVVRHRELLYLLVWRDIKVRYKQAVLGIAWAVLQPLVGMLIFTIVLGHFAGLANRTPNVSYPVSVLSGLILWTFFSNAVSQSISALLNSSQLITKVYFPRLIIPLAATTAALVDLAASFVILLVALPVFGIAPSGRLVLIFLPAVGTFLLAAGVGAATSALTVRFRDFRYVVPFGLQVWMFLSPVVYPVEVVPDRWRWVYYLNPITGLTESFRGAVLGSPMAGGALALSLVASCAVFALGARYFVSSERSFADTI